MAASRWSADVPTNPDVRPLPDVPATIPLRLHLLWKILVGIRANVESSFVLAVKINSSDFVQGGEYMLLYHFAPCLAHSAKANHQDLTKHSRADSSSKSCHGR